MAVHKLRDMNYEAILNFVNFHLHGVRDAEMVPPSFCSAGQLLFELTEHAKCKNRWFLILMYEVPVHTGNIRLVSTML